MKFEYLNSSNLFNLIMSVMCVLPKGDKESSGLSVGYLTPETSNDDGMFNNYVVKANEEESKKQKMENLTPLDTEESKNQNIQGASSSNQTMKELSDQDLLLLNNSNSVLENLNDPAFEKLHNQTRESGIQDMEEAKILNDKAKCVKNEHSQDIKEDSMTTECGEISNVDDSIFDSQNDSDE